MAGASQPVPFPESVDALDRRLLAHDYLPDRALSTSLFLALRMQRPLFLEGEAGVGKTEVAKVLAKVLGKPLVRLQCHEGLDVHQALYDWNYPRQMLEISLAQAQGSDATQSLAEDIYAPRFLVKRPLLQALTEPGGAVLLIDELDRADEPFDAFLLEVLADHQVTIPELGVVKPTVLPIVLITSNRTREVHDAIKRRCLYQWVGFPDAARELEILRRKLPQLSGQLSEQVVRFTQRVRGLDLFKSPGMAETLDWAEALMQLDAFSLNPELVSDTLGVLLKYQDDLSAMTPERVGELLSA